MPRPRNFNESSVLEAAGDMFWAKGYEATSTRDLVKCTGLSQPSLYNAFGDKRGLFRRALEHYLDRTMRERITRLEASLSPAHAISAFLAEIVDRSVCDVHQRGCMLVNSALEVSAEDEDLRQAIDQELTLMRSFFHRCLLAAEKNGEITLTLDAQAIATNLLAIQLGVRVMARVNPDRASLTAAVAPVLAMLGLPPLPMPPAPKGPG
jgi:TetR/AcrR family transcriptional repressor of nem operon